MNEDQRLREVLAASDHEPRPGFRADLRQQLHDEWHGRHTLHTSPTAAGPRRPWWLPVSAAAAVIALLIGGLVWIAQRGDDGADAPAATTPITGPATTATADPTVPPAPPAAADGGVDGPLMFAAQLGADEARMAALIVATLDLQGECLLAVGDGAQYPILWEHGTRWDPDAGAVVTPSGTRVRLLDTFEAGGGYVSELGEFASDPAVLERASHCAELAGTGEFAVVQSEPTVTGSSNPHSCFADVPADDALRRIVDAMLGARETGSASIAGACFPTVPDQFTGQPPHCWEACGERTIATDQVRWDEIVEPDDSTFWSLTVPVSYRTAEGYIDVVEYWHVRDDDGEWRVELSSIDPPLPQRAESLAALNQFLTAIAGGDWATAADLLTQGGASPEDRDDIRQLSPESFDQEGIAGALEAWCSGGCDTAPIADEELVFTGGYHVVRNGETLRGTWFEGSYGVSGVPWRHVPETPADALAAWPAPTLPPADALEALPFLVPSLAPADMPGLTPVRSESTTEEVGHYPNYHQVWFDADQSVVLHVQTVLSTPPGVGRDGTPTDIDGWEAAFEVATVSPIETVLLHSSGAMVTLQTIGMADGAAVELAHGLRPRPVGHAGWDLQGWESFAVFGEGWDSTGTGRYIHWTDTDGNLVGELRVVSPGAHQAMTDQHWPERRSFTDIGGAFAVVTETAGRVAITWQPAEDTTALFGWMGPVEEALAIARSLQPVNRAEWEAYADPDPMTDDGCNSLFC